MICKLMFFAYSQSDIKTKDDNQICVFRLLFYNLNCVHSLLGLFDEKVCWNLIASKLHNNTGNVSANSPHICTLSMWCIVENIQWHLFMLSKYQYENKESSKHKNMDCIWNQNYLDLIYYVVFIRPIIIWRLERNIQN